MSSLPKYGRLLRDHARSHNDILEYSEPQLVNGGMAPPPCRGLPGTVCYMVIVSVNHLDFFGFGPSAALAAHYAEKDAYTSISARETNGVQLPALVDRDEVNGYDESLCVSNTNSENENMSSALNNESESINKLKNGVDNGYPERTPDTVSTGEAYCAIPYESASEQPISKDVCRAIPYESASEQPISKDVCRVSHTVEKLNAVLEKPPPFRQAADTSIWERRNRNVVNTLFDVAKKRGIYDISFNFRAIGSKSSKQVVVRAFGGGFSFEGRHFQKKLAKCEAAAKLLETLSQLPELNCPASSHLARPLGLPISPDQNRVEDSFVQSSIQQGTKEAAKIDTPDRPLPVPPTPVNSVTSCASDEQNLLIVSNPIGQLNDLLAKEHLSDPVYTFTCCDVGENSDEFTCLASARGLFSKGVGFTKKQAKRCAAENLISEMKSQGININPSKSPTSSMKKNASPGGSLTGGHCNEQPRTREPLSQPRDLYYKKPLLLSTAHSAPRPPRDLPLPPPPLPFGPPPSYLRSPRRRDFPIRPILLPMHTHLRPPLPTHPHLLPPQPSHHHLLPTISPHTRGVPPQRPHLPSSDSESDSDCGKISSGLQEIIPASCSSNDKSPFVPTNTKSEDRTASGRKSEQMEYKHQRIPMPGVRIGTQHKESCTNTEGIIPKEEFRNEQLQTLGSSSDPLQFYTRLPQKRAKPWSSVDRPISGSKDKLVFSRLRQKEFRSNNTFTTKWRPQRKAEPWVLPESEMWDVISPSGAEETIQPTAIGVGPNNDYSNKNNCKKVEVNSNPVPIKDENKSHSTKNEHELDKAPKNNRTTTTACVEPVSTGSQEGGGGIARSTFKKVLAAPQAPLPVHPLLASYSTTKSPNYTFSRSYNSIPVTSTNKDNSNNISSPATSSPTSVKSRNEALNKRHTDKCRRLDMFSIVGSLSVTTDSSVSLPSEGSIENMTVSLY